MTAVSTIELDICLEDGEPILGLPAEVTAAKVADHGPGGGWPVYSFTGPRAALVAWLAHFYLGGADEDEAADYLDEYATA